MHGLGLRDVGKYLPTVLLKWSRNAFIFVRTNLSDWLLKMLKTGIRNRSKNCTGMYLPDARLRIFRISFDKSRLWPSTILLWNWGSRCRTCYRKCTSPKPSSLDIVYMWVICELQSLDILEITCSVLKLRVTRFF